MKNKLLKTTILAVLFAAIIVINAGAKTRHTFRHSTAYRYPIKFRRASYRHTSRYRASKRSLAEMRIHNVQFGFNKPYFSPAYKYELHKVVKLMSTNNVAVKLGGYADSKGTYLYNWKLSKQRVDNVKAYMVSNGADSTRIAATEYGDTKPIASNKTKAGRRKNRRVEIHFAD